MTGRHTASLVYCMEQKQNCEKKKIKRRNNEFQKSEDDEKVHRILTV